MPQQRFIELRNTLKPEQFNSVDFLTKKAQALKGSDPDLSARILLRVKNLKSKKLKIQKEKTSAEKVTVNQNKAIQQPVSVENNEIKNNITTAESIQKKVESKVQNKTPKQPKNKLTKEQRLKTLLLKPFMLSVILPSLIFAFYQIVLATERFESQAKVIVQQPDASATMDASMALLSGFGVQATGSDSELVKAYIYSNDMLQYLNKELDLRAHYSEQSIDYFSRIHKSDTKDTLFAYYEDHIDVILDEKSGVISIYVQAFDSKFAQQLNDKIVQRAEWFINSIGHQLADAQLKFMEGEHKNIERKFALAQTNLLQFQQRYNLLDPTAEGAAVQQVAYGLEGQIATKQTELKTLQAVMSNNSPQVKSIINQLKALQGQLKNERDKLAETGTDQLSVSEILSRFTEYKVNMELALQAYTSSQVSWEKARIEAYRQLKYLIVVEKSTLSEDSKYPDVIYNISLFILLLSLAFGIIKIVVSTIKELK